MKQELDGLTAGHNQDARRVAHSAIGPYEERNAKFGDRSGDVSEGIRAST